MPLSERDKRAGVRVRRIAAKDKKKQTFIGRTGRILFVDYLNKKNNTISVRYDRKYGETASVDDLSCDPTEFERVSKHAKKVL